MSKGRKDAEFPLIKPVIMRVWSLKREAQSIQAELSRIAPELSLEGQLECASTMFERMREIQKLLERAGLDWEISDYEPPGEPPVEGDEWKFA